MKFLFVIIDILLIFNATTQRVNAKSAILELDER
jgi:hypothetical protein